VRRQTESNNLVILAVLLEFTRVVALMTINNEQTVGANSTLLCMPVKVLYLVQAKLVGSPAVIRDSNNLVLRQILFFVPGREVVVGLEDKEGRNGPSFGINAYYSCSPLPVAWLDCLWPSSSL
jgi:hypothetical protein